MHFHLSATRPALAAFALVVISCFSLTASAQTDSSARRITRPEVIITGTPATPETPVPFERIGTTELREVETVQDPPRAAAQTPSALYWNQSGTDIGYSSINLRGFDQRRMSVMVNGIPQNDPEDHNVYWIDMPELLQYSRGMQIERGGGNALYGPPAIGGAINVETVMPSERNVTASFGGGSYNTSQAALSFASGLTNNEWAFFARASRTRTDGYRNFSWVHLNSYYASLAHYSDNLTLQFNAYGGPFEDGLNYYGIYRDTNLLDRNARKTNFSEPWSYERRPEEKENFFQPHFELLSSWKISPDVNFSNSFFYVKGNGQFDFDGTWPNIFLMTNHAEYYRLTPEYGARYGFTGIPDSDGATLGHELVRAFVGNNQFGWLPKLEVSHEMGKLTVGGEARIHRSLHWGQLLSADTLPTNLPADYHFYEYNGAKDIFSLYASEVYDATNDLTLSAGVHATSLTYRNSNEKQFFLNGEWRNYEIRVPLFFVNPHAGATLKLSPDASVYASIALTSREPRLKDYYNPEFFSVPNFAMTADSTGYNLESPNIKPERMTDIEAGVRGSFEGVQTEVGFYLMDFRDELVKTGKSDLFGSDIFGNAEHTRHYGVELDLRGDAAEWLSLRGNMTISKNEILEFSQNPDAAAVKGKQPIGFPSFMSAGEVVVRPVEGLSAIAMGRYVGSFFGDLLNTESFRNPAYFVLDAIASYKFELSAATSIEARGQINNVFDRLYTTYASTSTGFFVAAPRHFFGRVQVSTGF